MTEIKRSVLKERLDASLRKVEETEARGSYLANRSGQCGKEIIESLPAFNKTKTEKVITNNHGAFIVLGRDRPGNECSGYGGNGHTHCASMDLVVGRMSYLSRARTSDDQKIIVDPSFRLDSARIYMSQKTDVDRDFELPKGTFPLATTRSAIALKADGIRLIAREGIKLISGADNKNSQGGTITPKAYGINLIAGGDDRDMQPFVKGNNLKDLLVEILNHVGKLNGIINSFLHSQIQYNVAISQHTHISPFFAIPDTPPPVLPVFAAKALTEQVGIVQRDLYSNRLNLAVTQLRYLQNFSQKYINSRFNYTN